MRLAIVLELKPDSDSASLRSVLGAVADARALGLEVCVFASSGRGGSRREESRLGQHAEAALRQLRLVAECAAALKSVGLRGAEVVVSRHDVTDQARYRRLRDVVAELLRAGVVPLLFPNELFVDEPRGQEVLAVVVVTALQVDKLLVVHLDDQLQESTESDRFRVLKLATSFGAELHSFTAGTLGALRDLLLSNVPSSVFLEPRASKLRLRKSWVGLAAETRGTIVVSTFLAEALRARTHASVLMIGVEATDGNFQQNDVVNVVDLTGKVLGRGQTRLSSTELAERLALRHAGKDEHVFGYEVVHCDYFVHAPVEVELRGDPGRTS